MFLSAVGPLFITFFDLVLLAKYLVPTGANVISIATNDRCFMFSV